MLDNDDGDEGDEIDRAAAERGEDLHPDPFGSSR